MCYPVRACGGYEFRFWLCESDRMLRFFNTLTRRKEEFVPLDPPNVRMYTCGPTVYSFIHIGNLRTFLFEDLLRRYLKSKGYKVTQVMNITDIDDKTIKGARDQGVSLSEFTKPYIDAFFQDIDAVGIERAEYYPRATEHIDDMVALVQRLLDKGAAYESEGSIYFDVSKFKPYGALTGVKPSLCQIRSRIDHDEYDRDDIRDFVLWKGKKEGEPYWDTPIGPGRPGWHIECSAMSMRYLGETFDIHTGGVDNMFPHHENEIAQSQAATGKPLARFWLHSEHLLLDKSKMAKSEGNIYTLRDIVAMGYKPRQLRYLLITAHYRKQLSFSLETLEQAGASLQRLDDFVRALRAMRPRKDDSDSRTHSPDNPQLAQAIAACKNGFQEAMDDDLNIAKAMGELFTFVRKINEEITNERLSQSDRAQVENLLANINRVVGFLRLEQDEEVSPDVEELIRMRQEARQRKDYAAADRIREQLREKGIIVEDTRDGVRIKRIR